MDLVFRSKFVRLQIQLVFTTRHLCADCRKCLGGGNQMMGGGRFQWGGDYAELEKTMLNRGGEKLSFLEFLFDCHICTVCTFI